MKETQKILSMQLVLKNQILYHSESLNSLMLTLISTGSLGLCHVYLVTTDVGLDWQIDLLDIRKS
jgi:hypothetical protein